jgi:acetyltransferase-like isoleucine patch superfamily enzyme
MLILMSRLIVRRAISLLNNVRATLVSHCGKVAIKLGNDGISLGSSFRIADGVRFSCTDGGKIIIGSNFYASSGCSLVCRGGHLIIGDHVFLGNGVNIVCRDYIKVGSDCLIAEYVVIRDQDHSLEPPPVRHFNFNTSPILIGRGVWIGAKASVLRGGEIGDGSVVGAHSLVKSPIPSSVLAVGAPAKAVKNLPL